MTSDTNLLVEIVKNGSELQIAGLIKDSLAKDVNKPSTSEEYPLHIAVWRNHSGIVRTLLKAGADPDMLNGENGWTPLHKALYWGHLRVAAQLIAAHASTDVKDYKGRTAIDLVSQELGQHCQQPHESAALAAAPNAASQPQTRRHASAVFSWGSGANYQLGTGSTDFAESPVRVEAIGLEESATTSTSGSGGASKPVQPAGSSSTTATATSNGSNSAGGAGLAVVAVVAAKFHSAAVTADGRLWTWGWGRGGRLGHPDFHVHSGEAALIHPWPVQGLGKRHVVCVAAGKHHMLAATTAGEVWSWGSNKDGRLGYGGVDTQPTPTKIATLPRGTRIIAVAAANKHSVGLSSGGEVFTWGGNGQGQLGYGTTGGTAGAAAACNPTPRVVDALKGRVITAISAAKRHTAAVSKDGEVWVWGHRGCTPRRVPLAGCRDTTRFKLAAPATAAGSGAAADVGEHQLVFHRGHSEMMKPHAVAVAAGFTHTTVLTRDGALLVWLSEDPGLRVHEVKGGLAGKRVVSVCSSKYCTAAVTAEGEVWTWESKGGAASFAPSAAAGEGSSSWREGGAGGQGLCSSSSGALGSSVGGVGSVGATNVATTMGGRRGSKDLLATAAPAQGGPGLAVPGGAMSGAVRPVRVSGLRRVSQVCVGEKHTLALCTWAMPPLPDELGVFPAEAMEGGAGANSDSDADELEFEGESTQGVCTAQQSPGGIPATSHHHHHHHHGHHDSSAPRLGFGVSNAGTSEPRQGVSSWREGEDGLHMADDEPRPPSAVPTLQVLTQQAVAQQLVEPRTALQILEYADVAGAALLRAYCIATALRNLDAVLAESAHALLALPPHLVAELEQHYKAWLQPPRPSPAPQHPPPSSICAATNTLHRTASASTRDEAATPGGGSPALGSSPVSGSWVEMAADRLWRGSVSGAAGSASASVAGGEAGGAQVNGDSGSATPTALAAASAAATARKKQLLSKLQLPRRPTSVPAWLDGGETHGPGALLPQVSARLAAHAAEAALSAIGRWPGHHQLGEDVGMVPGGSPPSEGGGGQPQALSRPHGSVGPEAEAQAAAGKLLRNVHKKLQQIAVLEERAAGGGGDGRAAALDPQQLAKLGQKATLLEAAHMLEAGMGVESVQSLVAHAQEMAAKIVIAAEGSSGSGGQHQQQQSGAAATSSKSGGGGQAARAGVTLHAGLASKGVTGSGGKGSGGGAVPGDGMDAISFRAVTEPHLQNCMTPTPVPAPPSGGVDCNGVMGGETAGTVGQPGPSSNSTRVSAADTANGVAKPGNAGKEAGGVGASLGKEDRRGSARRGGLSAFLSGALDKRASPAPPVSATPKGPAWGGALTRQASSGQFPMLPPTPTPSQPFTTTPSSATPVTPGLPAMFHRVSHTMASPGVCPSSEAPVTPGPLQHTQLSSSLVREMLGPQVSAGSISAAAGGNSASAAPSSTGGGGGGGAWVTPQTKSRPPRDMYTPIAAVPFPAVSPYPPNTHGSHLMFPLDSPAPPTPPHMGSLGHTVRTLSLADFLTTPKPAAAAKGARGDGNAGGHAARGVAGTSPPGGGWRAPAGPAARGVGQQQASLKAIQAEQAAAKAVAPLWKGAAASVAGDSKGKADKTVRGKDHSAAAALAAAAATSQAAGAGASQAGSGSVGAKGSGGCSEQTSFEGRGRAGGGSKSGRSSKQGVTVQLHNLGVGGGGERGVVLGSSPPAQSKWYVPEPVKPRALAAIQTEETAIQEIAKLYKGKAVKVARSGDTGARSVGASGSGGGAASHSKG